MTSNVTGGILGIMLATAGATAGTGFEVESLVQNGLTVTGAGLMAWYIVSLHKEMRTLRDDHRKEREHLLARVDAAMDERVKACANCSLAREANHIMTDAASQHINNKPKKTAQRHDD